MLRRLPSAALRLTFALLATSITIGCVGQVAEEGEAPPIADSGAGGDNGAENSDEAEEESPYQAAIDRAMAELSEEDRALALQQKNCPVTDEPLGSMGKPLKVEVEGQQVFLCCEGCEGMIEAEPAKYLAKLNPAP